MSDSDQQYPYPHDPGHDQQEQPYPRYDPRYDRYPQGQGYAQQGQPYPQQGQQGAYGAPPVPSQDAYAAPYAHPSGQDGRPPGQAPQEPAGHPWQGHAGNDVHGAADQGASQTWQGQTWDTQYQPTIQPQAPQAPQAAYRPVEEPQPYHQPEPRPQDAAYDPAPHPAAVRGGAPAAYPLPPEAPVTPPAPEAHAGAGTGTVPTGDDPGYSAPTTLGNSRITDAQRARAEGRSPIIAPGMQPAALTAGLGLLLALGAAIGPYALLVPLVLLQAVTAAGWFRLNGMWPARQGIALAFAGGLVADVVLLVAGRDDAPAALLGTLGVWVLLTLVLQLRSHAGADERMYGLTATVASAALAVLAAGHLAAVPDAVTVGGIAVAAAVVVRALPLPGPVSVVVALLAPAAAGALLGGFTDFGAQAALLGFAAGGCALIGLRVASYDYPSRFVHMTAGVALPLTAAAPAVYLIGRALT
ncbi:hypothetical protein [Streptomyces griseus]|uniref:hypothetical protein n=1 Tax=Streptomyces griseus TaxID=1911 RepID=UPI00083FF6F0|nr:hypothetical protein [Streptomyces griseus]